MALIEVDGFDIKGMQVSLPFHQVSLLDDPKLYFGDIRRKKRLVESSGFLKRRIAQPNVTALDLCFEASKNLLNQTNTKPEDIDALIFLGYTPDYLMPGNSYVLHNKLGLKKECIVVDIQQACAGFVMGLLQAGIMFRARMENILLCVGDTFNKFTDMFPEGSPNIFGDGGSATLLKRGTSKAQKFYFCVETFSENWKAISCLNGGFRNPIQEGIHQSYESKMDGKEVFRFTMSEVAKNIRLLEKYSGIALQDIDLVGFHQANKFILENIVEELGVPKNRLKMDSLKNNGNLCGSSIPALLVEEYSNLLKTGENTVLFSGFGVGLIVASMVGRLNRVDYLGINYV